MIVNLPRGLTIDIDYIPDDFDDRIEKCFQEFTNGTDPEYMFHDKLAFIDRTVSMIRGNMDEEQAVRKMLHDLVDYSLDYNGDMPDENDYDCFSFLQDAYMNGRDSQKLYNGAGNEKVTRLLFRIIRLVINYGEKKSVEYDGYGYDDSGEIIYDYDTAYCPNCGAKMDGGNKDD